MKRLTETPLDPGFGNAGVATLTHPDYSLVVLGDLATAADEAIFAAVMMGGTESTTTHVGIAKLDRTGQLDRSFGQNGFAIAPDEATAHEPRLLVLGNGSLLLQFRRGIEATQRQQAVLMLCRPDGIYDDNFAVQGKLAPGGDGDHLAQHELQMIERADGKLIFIGAEMHRNTVTRLFALRTDRAGIPDSTFGDAGYLTLNLVGYPRPIGGSSQTDDRVLVASHLSTSAIVQRFLVDGTIDDSFVGNGKLDLGGTGLSQFRISTVLTGADAPLDGAIVLTGTCRAAVDQGFLYRGTEKGPDFQFGDGDLLRPGLARVPDTLGQSQLLTGVKAHDAAYLVGGQLTGMTNRGLLVARYGIDGKLDEAFADGGWAWAQQRVDAEEFRALAPHGADHVLVGAQRTPDGQTTAAVVLRLATGMAHADGASRSWLLSLLRRPWRYLIRALVPAKRRRVSRPPCR